MAKRSNISLNESLPRFEELEKEKEEQYKENIKSTPEKKTAEEVLVLRFFIVRLYMCADRKATLDEYFVHSKVNPGCSPTNPHLNSNEFEMSKKQFERMHQHFHFHLEHFALFNEKFETFVCDLFYLIYVSY